MKGKEQYFDAYERRNEWLVIGVGPAGIAAVGRLIDHGVQPEKIGWMDPHFQVGDLGMKWGAVPSNTKVSLFMRFLEGSEAFGFMRRHRKFPIESIPLDQTCELRDIASPLQWISDELKKKVHPIQDFCLALNLCEGRWEAKTKGKSAYSKNVILAIGADPKTMDRSGIHTIELETALDKEKLRKAVGKEDVVGVFGASHSAILVLANQLDVGAKKVIHFYRSPHRYAVFLEDWILFDDTGLKGFAASWARKHLDGRLPTNLERISVLDRISEERLATCNKAVYAVGFDRRKLPVLEQYDKMQYEDRTGIIAPGLFGIGIAFPQAKFNRLGQLEYRVGLWKFMDDLNGLVPIWLKYANF